MLALDNGQQLNMTSLALLDLGLDCALSADQGSGDPSILYILYVRRSVSVRTDPKYRRPLNYKHSAYQFY